MSLPADTTPEGEPPPPARRPGSFALGRIAGLTIEGPLILLPLMALVAFVLATGLLPWQEQDAYSSGEYWLMGVLGALLLLLSMFAHELAHAITGRGHGLPVRRVSLFFHGERFDERHEGRSPGAEMLIAAVGPATTIVLGGAAWAVALLLPELRLVAPLARFAGVANLLLGFMSLIPALPLDGGRIVRALFWHLTGSRLQGTRFACLSGRAVAALLFTVAIVLALSGGFGSEAFWLIALALVMYLQAGAIWRLARVREGLDGVTAGELAGALPPVLPRQVSVQDALFSPEYAGLRDAGRGFLIEFQGRLGGVVGLRDLRRVPEAERFGTPVWELTTRLRREHLLDAALPAGEALRLLIESRLPLLPVLAEGQLLGVVTREALDRAIEDRLGGRSAAVQRNPEPPPA